MAVPMVYGLVASASTACVTHDHPSTATTRPADAARVADQAMRRAPADAATSNTRGVRPVRAG